LHYLADRASITGKFSDAECLKLDVVFPHFISLIESMLTTGELNPRHAYCVILYHNDFPCEADPLGSCGYLSIAVYPTQR
uniref:type IV toxin-antitoxin system YeeU family antitoxin n=1 Tax=Citrobacter braakii TaxID=57706 RepID=UPI00117D61E2